MAFDGNITIGTSVDVGGINTGLNKISNQFRKLQRISAGVLGIGALTKLSIEAVKVASDLQEVRNIVDVTFEEMSYKVERFSNIAIEKFGLSRLSAQQTAGSFQAMGRAMGLSLETSSNMAIQLSALSGDFASFFNLRQDYARVALSAVYTGETETLKRYGVVLTEANLQQYAFDKGIEASVKSMSAREKVILRYMYIMENLSFIQGDFERTENSWANQTRVLKEQWTEFLIVIGNGMVTVLTPLIGIMNEIIAVMIKFAKTIMVILGNIFGIDLSGTAEQFQGMADSASDAALAEDELADAVTGAGKAAKKSLAPFDDLNVLQKQTASSGSGGSITDDLFGDFEIEDPTESWIGKITENITSSIDNLFDFGVYLGDTLKNMLERIDWDYIFQGVTDIGTGLAEFLNGFISPDVFASVSKTIANALNTAIYGLKGFGEEFDWTDLGNSISAGINNFFDTFDFGGFADTLDTWVQGLFEVLRTVIKETDWTGILDSIEEFFKTIDIETIAIIVGTLIVANAKKIALGSALISSISKLSKLLSPYINTALGTAFTMAMPKIANLFGFTLTSNMIGIAKGSTIKETISIFVTTIVNLFKLFFKTKFAGLAPTIKTVFSTILSSVGTMIKGWGASIGDKLIYPIQMAFHSLKGAIDTFIYNLGSGQGLAASLSGAFGTVATTIAGVVSVIAGAVMAVINFVSMWEEGFHWLKEILMILGIIIAVIGAIILGASAWPAVIVGAIVAAIATIAILVHDNWEAIKSWFVDAGTWIWETVLKPIIDYVVRTVTQSYNSIKGIFNAIMTFLAPVFDWINNNVIQPLKAGFEWLSYNIKAIFEGIWLIIRAIWTIAYEWFSENVINPIVNLFKYLADEIPGFFAGLWEGIVSFFTGIPEWINENVLTPLGAFFESIWKFVTNVCKGAWEGIKNIWKTAVAWFNETVVIPAIALFTLLWETVSGFFLNIWEQLKVILQPLLTWFNETIILPLTELFRGIWETVSGFFSSLWEDIKGVWGTVSVWFDENVVQPVVAIWETATQQIQEFFTGLWNGIQLGAVTAMNAVIKFIENALNEIITSINNLLQGFNNVAQWAANVVGEDWGGVQLLNKVSLTKIPVPALANGTVIPPNAPFLALLGDQKRGTNIEAPLDTIKQAVAEVLGANGGNNSRSSQPVVLQIDGQTLARLILPSTMDEMKRVGYNVSMIGG